MLKRSVQRTGKKDLGVGGDGTDRDDDRRRGLRDREHVAAAVEEGAGIHDETWGEDFAGDDGFGLDFDFALGSNDSIEAAGNNDVVPFNFTLDVRVLADNQGFVRYESSLRGAVDSKGAGGFEAAFELDSLFEEAGPFTGVLPFAVKPTQSH
jgi:hypothetical protein